MKSKVMRVSGLQRRLSTEIAGGARLLRGPHALETATVHNARKALKRARAGLRLIRDAANKKVYARDNGRLRDAATSLSKLRDDAVLLEKLRRMRKKMGDAESKLVAVVEDELKTEQKRLLGEAREKKIPAKTAELVGKIAQDIERRPLARTDKPVIAAGLKRIYRKGRTATKIAAKQPDENQLHEARKQAKYLFNAMAMVTKNGRAGSKKTLKRAERVGDKLGDDHDLVLLEARLKKVEGAEFKEAREAVLSGIRKRRKKLQKKAFRQGKALYRKKPNAFVESVRSI